LCYFKAQKSRFFSFCFFAHLHNLLILINFVCFLTPTYWLWICLLADNCNITQRRLHKVLKEPLIFLKQSIACQKYARIVTLAANKQRDETICCFLPFLCSFSPLNSLFATWWNVKCDVLIACQFLSVYFKSLMPNNFLTKNHFGINSFYLVDSPFVISSHENWYEIWTYWITWDDFEN
jgi:hypothetical protein